MSYFKNIYLLKAPQAYGLPEPRFISDLTEICYLAAAVEKEVDSVSIPVDFYGRNPYRDFVQFLKDRPVDLVGISAMTGAYNNALRLAEIAKRSGAYVVMGGYHPTALPEEVLKSPYVDSVLIGEGERTFRELVMRGPSREVAGMVIKDNGGLVRTEPRPLIADLDALPHPLRSARPRRFGERGDAYSIDTIYTSRGCPWRCKFCANDIVNKHWRARSPENVVEEMAQIHDPQRKKLLKIWDANFLTNITRAEEICDLMLERGLTHFKIWTETRVDDILRAQRILDKMYRVGFRNVSLGIESPNPETLRLMNKKNKVDSAVHAVLALRKHKIKIQGYFIIGHYSETRENTKEYPLYAEGIGLHQAVFMVMTPYPGTAIFEEYKRENKIESYNWDLYNNFCAVVETKGMDRKTLQEMVAHCWGRFYTRCIFVSNKKLCGVTFAFLFHLSIMYTIFRFGKNTWNEIEDRLFDFLEAGCRCLSRPVPRNAPLFLRWFGEFTIRFTHSRGESVEFHMTQNNGARRLTAKRTESGGPIRGITFHLQDIMTLCEKIDTKIYILLACRADAIKNNPKGRWMNILSLATDRDLFLLGSRFLHFLAVHVA
ncbi:MAG: B12-binding domain-containing radical SAM protein, partial [Planctomycetes bacterium]|nr:B12-binding domain-containing radical SAM protein [Planctomycetota bacterium]